MNRAGPMSRERVTVLQGRVALVPFESPLGKTGAVYGHQSVPYDFCQYRCRGNRT